MRSKYFSVLCLLVAVILSCSCSKLEPKYELYVSAAVSLKDVLKDLREPFESEHPGAEIIYNFSASGLLAAQIIQGAPADVFISASKAQMDMLAQKQLLMPDSVEDCAGNSLVVISREKKLSSLSDLLKLKTLALGNPKTVPAGEYARQALVAEKIFDRLQSGKRLVFAEDARQVLAYVESGDVDAGIVYNTDALEAEKAKVCFTIDRSLTGPIRYQIACLKNSKQVALAQEFCRFIQSTQSQDAFKKKGFVYE